MPDELSYRRAFSHMVTSSPLCCTAAQKADFCPFPLCPGQVFTTLAPAGPGLPGAGSNVSSGGGEGIRTFMVIAVGIFCAFCLCVCFRKACCRALMKGRSHYEFWRSVSSGFNPNTVDLGLANSSQVTWCK